VVRVATGETVFNSTPVEGVTNGLVFEEQFIQLSTLVEHDPIIYGLGEQNAPLKLPAGREHGMDVYTIFTRDQFTPAHRAGGGTGLYGAHPFALQLLRTGQAHGLFVRSSNAMDVVLTQDALTARLTGGILDLSLFLGPSAADVVGQYTALVGRPALPPSWALGFHLCRWGYASVDAVRAAADRMWAEGLPQDAQWTDIDYMDGFRDFTFDPARFPETAVRGLVGDLHARGQRYVAIVDPGIAARGMPDGGPYAPYDEGLRQRVFVHDAEGAPVHGVVWPGSVAWPDFGHPNATAYWGGLLADMHGRVPLDGLWLDMNEPSNFCDGACTAGRLAGCDPAAAAGAGARYAAACAAAAEVEESQEEREAAEMRRVEEERERLVYAPWKLRAKGGRRFHPAQAPYVPGGGASLSTRTLPMTAQHCWNFRLLRPTAAAADGGGGGAGGGCAEVLHYDVHNLYGLTEARVSAAALARVRGGRRGLVISRSTYAGAGADGGHWLGDNRSRWADLRASIAGVLAMGLLGVPLVGADVCGFTGDAGRELCVRWTQLGAWYPFARNHNDRAARPQEPYAFGPAAAALMRRALRRRYRLLPYLYTAFAEARDRGAPVARPVWMEVPAAAAAAAAHIDDQLFVGAALLVSPVVEPGARRRTAYFPAGPWFDLSTGARLVRPDDWSPAAAAAAAGGGAADGAAGGRVTVEAPLWHIPVHVRGGHVVPVQRAARTTAAVRRTPVTLLAAPDARGRALGRLYLDDGESLPPPPPPAVPSSSAVPVASSAASAGAPAAAAAAYARVGFTAFVLDGGRRGNLTAAVDAAGYDPARDPGVGRRLRYEEVRVVGVEGLAVGPDPPEVAATVNGRRLPAAAAWVDRARAVLCIRLDGRAARRGGGGGAGGLPPPRRPPRSEAAARAGRAARAREAAGAAGAGSPRGCPGGDAGRSSAAVAGRGRAGRALSRDLAAGDEEGRGGQERLVGWCARVRGGPKAPAGPPLVTRARHQVWSGARPVERALGARVAPQEGGRFRHRDGSKKGAGTLRCGATAKAGELDGVLRQAGSAWWVRRVCERGVVCDGVCSLQTPSSRRLYTRDLCSTQL
jgi:alpha-glucosidase (family GH31 glycosyl hydrolase)